MFKKQSNTCFYRGIFLRINKKNLNISMNRIGEIYHFIEKNYPKDEGLLKIYKINTTSHKKECIKKVRICQSLELVKYNSR
ncbi:MAG: hypothetical protein GF317_06860 [Candidatus Lokiarchaeota archaeon]|nr:hypothetical protein [Candidatus Lokiarchaeota archaeon]MBD3199430.1 hypothetical protein [Candidatus Lokiarchaeota archaeon]